MPKANPAAIKGSIKAVPKGKRNGDILIRGGKRYRVVSYRHPSTGTLVRYLQAVTKCGSPAKKASCKTRVTKRRNPVKKSRCTIRQALESYIDACSGSRAEILGAIAAQGFRPGCPEIDRLSRTARAEAIRLVEKTNPSAKRRNPYASGAQPCHMPQNRSNWRSGHRHISQGRSCVVQRTRTPGGYVSMSHAPLSPPLTGKKKGSTFTWGGQRWRVATRKTRAGGYRRYAKEI